MAMKDMLSKNYRINEVAKYTITAEHSDVIVLIQVDHMPKVIPWMQVSLERRVRLRRCSPVIIYGTTRHSSASEAFVHKHMKYHLKT